MTNINSVNGSAGAGGIDPSVESPGRVSNENQTRFNPEANVAPAGNPNAALARVSQLANTPAVNRAGVENLARALGSFNTAFVLGGGDPIATDAIREVIDRNYASAL